MSDSSSSSSSSSAPVAVKSGQFAASLFTVFATRDANGHPVVLPLGVITSEENLEPAILRYVSKTGIHPSGHEFWIVPHDVLDELVVGGSVHMAPRIVRVAHPKGSKSQGFAEVSYHVSGHGSAPERTHIVQLPFVGSRTKLE